MKIVFDIDSTITNIDHRHHFIGEWVDEVWIRHRKPDYNSFYDAAIDDVPIHQAVELYHALAQLNHNIEFWTGRPEYLRGPTRAWLEKYLGESAGCRVLKMRPTGDRRSNVNVKLEYIDPVYPPALIFEDHKKTVDAFRAKGLIVYQVASGDF